MAQDQNRPDIEEKADTRYFPSQIEEKWQSVWEDAKLHEFHFDPTKSTYYTLVEFPYPSGDLHLGHWFSFATADVHARYKKMSDANVFFTNGFDAFGLPAENAAIKRGIHPQDWTLKNIETMKKQFATMGSMIDWSHQVITCLPEYYRWNQWIFIQMYKKGLAYKGKALTNWCPVDKTVLANENVENGRCWRCGSEVVQKEVEQWFLKITDYADRLEWGEKPLVDWPLSVREGQNNWIGRKEGIEITYEVIIKGSKEPKESKGPNGGKLTTTVFTTRPDTNFGASFIALAPEHPLVEQILANLEDEKIKQEVRSYVETASKKTEMDRMLEGREKSGVFTGAYALNELTGHKMPIWVSDFVLMNFGTGALVGVPGHDKRDFEFAQMFGLEIKRVVKGSDGNVSPIICLEQVQEEEGTMINSGFLDGMGIHEATEKIMDYMVEKGYGRKVVTYHIHDWSVSRQRYWGTPVPMIHCEKDGIVPVPEDQLPVTLPYNVDFAPKGEPPLATDKEWLNTTCPLCGGPAKREAETLDTFFDSSWYYYRYVDPHYAEGPFPEDLVNKMLPVDIYFGGAEHTLGHTLYARFFTKFFHDIGLVTFDEFAKRRVQHGVILGPDGNRMSKSKGNVVNPDDVVKEYGADATRLYLCFMMPYDATAPWNPQGVWGVFRFLKRVWDLRDKVDGSQLSREDLFHMHTAIKKVGEDIAATKFNTAVSEMMKWLNHLESKQVVSEEEYKNLLLILAPFAPHMTEELRQLDRLSESYEGDVEFKSIHSERWPTVDESLLVAETVTLVAQVNGKVRASMTLSAEDAQSQEKVAILASENEKIKAWLEGKEIKKTIFVPQKLINFVI